MIEVFSSGPTGAAEMDRDEEAAGSQNDQVSFDGSEAADAEDTDDDAYAVAERDDEELLKTVFQKVSRWEHKEASRIKVLHLHQAALLCKCKPVHGEW